MTHYTLSGFYAGQTICGTARLETDTYVHYGSMYRRPHPLDLCPKCRAIVDSIDEDEESE